MAVNKCGGGFCSRSLADDIVKCQQGLPSDWNGKCAYQNGRLVEDDDMLLGAVALHCCANGCAMPVAQYAGWNGKCAYQDL